MLLKFFQCLILQRNLSDPVEEQPWTSYYLREDTHKTVCILSIWLSIDCPVPVNIQNSLKITICSVITLYYCIFIDMINGSIVIMLLWNKK